MGRAAHCSLQHGLPAAPRQPSNALAWSVAIRRPGAHVHILHAGTLTVIKLGLPATLRRSLSTTNMLENLNGSIRRVTHNVKRLRGSDMRRRWVGLAISDASKRFHRIKGHRDLPLWSAPFVSSPQHLT
jgi:hypothetical protein